MRDWIDRAAASNELLGSLPRGLLYTVGILLGCTAVLLFVSLFAGFMPVPGGVGVAEAGFTAGLIAIGIPEGAATSTALAFRLVTFYLPPLWGVFAMRWMKSQSYL